MRNKTNYLHGLLAALLIGVASSAVSAPSTVDTLQRVLVVGRWLCWAWMVGVVTFGYDALVHPGVAWFASAAASVRATCSLSRSPRIR